MKYWQCVLMVLAIAFMVVVGIAIGFAMMYFIPFPFGVILNFVYVILLIAWIVYDSRK